MISTAEAYGLVFGFPSADTGVGACLRDYGEFARPEIDLILALCDGDLVDVGANIGAIGLPFAKAKPECSVVAVEAHPQLADLLRDNVARNALNNVTVVSAAAGELSAEITIPALDLTAERNVGATSLYERSEKVATTKMVRLDDIAPSNPRFVKVDVEGFEPRVLLGAPRTLRDTRPTWLVEVSQQRPNAAREARQLLSDAGYQLYWFFSPFLTRRRPKRLDERPKLRGDVALLAADREPPWAVKRATDEWPKDVSDFPYLSDYGLVSGSQQGR